MQDKILDLQTITKFQFVSLSLYHNKIIISHILKNHMPVWQISYIYPITYSQISRTYFVLRSIKIRTIFFLLIYNIFPMSIPKIFCQHFKGAGMRSTLIICKS